MAIPTFLKQKTVRTAPTWNDVIRVSLKKDAVEIDQTVIRYSTEATVNNTKQGKRMVEKLVKQ